MATLSITNTYVAGNLIKSSEHNQNFTDVVSWANGNIQQDNLGTLSGQVTWIVTSNSLAQNISNAGTQGSVNMTYTGSMAAGKSVIRLSNSTAQTLADAACIYAESTNPSTTTPAVKISQSGSGAALQVDSTTAGALLPRMTTVQRTALTAVEGVEIWNTTLKRKEVYNGTYWVAAAGNSGTVVQWPGSSIPPYMVLCDGSTLAVDATNAYAISVLGSTWGASGQLPDNRGRAPICSGTGSGLTARTLGQQSIGEETHVLTTTEMPSHSHTATTSSDGSHTHTLTARFNAGVSAHGHFGGGVSEKPSDDTGSSSQSVIDPAGTHSHTLTTATSGSGVAHNVVQPSIVYHVCMVL
jgi:microcystin-dependent protein